jgi:hypothetical protein
VKSRALNDLRLARLRLQVPVSEKLPALLQDAIDACALIVTERERFPELGSGRGQARFQFTESMRERDLRRLEGMALVGMSVFLHLDLVRLRTGRCRADGSSDGVQIARPRHREGRDRLYVDRFTQTTIEDETGLGRSALFGALRDLRDAGYIEVHQEIKRFESELAGEWRFRGFPAVITVSKLFFQRLGIDLDKLEEQRQLASRREKEKQPDKVIVDVRLRRERQRVIRNMHQIAARSARLNPNFERTGEERLERLRRLQEKRKRE